MNTEIQGEQSKPTPQQTIILPPELKNLDPKILQAAQSYFLLRYHSGPIPPPDTLAAYEGACIGAARDIVDMAKIEQANRHLCDRDDSAAITRGQQYAISAFVIAMLAVCYIAYLGGPIAAATMGGIAITAFGGAFLLATHRGSTSVDEVVDKPNRSKKNKQKQGRSPP